MKSNFYYYISDTFNPYLNIAKEEQLLLGVPEDAFILYLWQNERTVVIGRNQCAWRECAVDQLIEDKGTLARRLSGGGSVYHDLGNVNFTFLYPKSMENIQFQTNVIAETVNQFGLNAEISGRNDITIDGRKFSGNAYYTQGKRAYHHGTIMLSVDQNQLSRYLNVHPDKYRSKGVDSVRSRVINLRELIPSLGVKEMQEAFIRSFEQQYGAKVQEIPDEWLKESEIQDRKQHFSSWNWVYGQPIPFTWEKEQRFSWSLLRIELDISKGIIVNCAIYTDAMQTDLFTNVSNQLRGLKFEKETFSQVEGLPEHSVYFADLKSLLHTALEQEGE